VVKSLVGKIGTLALLSAFAGSAAVACSSELVSKGPQDATDGTQGGVDLSLVPVAGVTLNSVNYVVTGTPTIPGTPLPSGVLPTPGTDANFSFGIPVPVGTGYTLSLTAASAEVGDDITCTGSFGPFDVTPNTSSNFTLTLTCVDNSNGQLIGTVGVVTTDCPRLIPDYVSAIPSTAQVGGSIAVNALGHDLDGNPVTYAWSIPAASAAVGSFTAPGAQATSFNCTGPGSGVPVTVTMDNGECDKTIDTTISCASVTCPDGTLDLGEDCDPGIPAGQPGGGTFGCPADCTLECGDGVTESPAEECEIPGGVPTGDCTAECRNRAIQCGDGFLTTGEICDGTLFPAGTPPGSSCASDCSSITAAFCGDGSATGGEECDPGQVSGETVGSFTCSNDCEEVATQACVDCEQNGSCFEFSDSCILNTTNATDRGLCFDVQECIQDSNCADGANTLTSCYCGALSNSACLAASPADVAANPCATTIRLAMGAGSAPDGLATNQQVLTRYSGVAFPGSAAISRFTCSKGSATCSPLCGF